ncbi:CPBP family intramembrane glutamic endopeptidase [Mucilaginibacter flavus]|uniref:CPBP family intramembrane glutamic endopeptidase n=1 Tax=Mucilaginibacter flavus TaxID=931504 RepID=UPI0025B41D4B|nr:type II CAAX endopeptidase family protein [Mucilaginibacter flavus]MDN3581822.1 type II CAAX endopeptidase family protein [Mucilaginibacter flavus]
MITILKEKEHDTVLKGLILTVIMMMGFTAISKVFSIYTASLLSIDTRFFVSRMFFWAYFAAIYLYVVIREKQSLLLWPENKYGTGFYILSVILILLVVIIGAAVAAVVLKSMGLLKQSRALPLMLHMNTPVKLLGIITAGFLEEFIFRGYMMPRLQLFFKSHHLPIIISSIVFGLLHVGYGTVVNVVVPVIIGLVFGYHYQQYRNIKILIICHLLIDLNALFTPLLVKH